MTIDLGELLPPKTVIPVLQINSADEAVPLAGALIQGGLRVLEITLRTDAAEQSARNIIQAFPDALVGIGTVRDAVGLQKALSLNAGFAVSPGSTPELLTAATESGLPFLPGVSTVSEVMTARAAGFKAQKLFPAVHLGGTAMLKSLGALFEDVKFCPTGGVDRDNLADYLGQANVFSVGGSWLAPAGLVSAGEWQAIADLARSAVETASRFAAQ